MKKANRRSKQASPAASSSSPGSDDKRKQNYEERVRQLEQENKAFQKEIEELRGKVASGNNGSLSPASNGGVEKLKEDYLQKLNVLEEQVTELKKKQHVQSQLSTKRPKGNEATRRLQFEIQSLKAQKVQLHCKNKLESVQFRLSKASLEKEVLQLRKEKRRNAYEMQKLLASNQRLKMVLQRKTEEASAATKRLRELIESRKALLRRSAGARVGKTPGVQVLEGVEHEFGTSSWLHELCSQYERQMEEMAEEVAMLREESELLKQENLRCPLQEKEVDCLEQDEDIKDLKEQIVSLSGLVRQLQIQKAEFVHKEKSQDNLGQPSFSTGSSEDFFHSLDTCESEHFGDTNAAKEKNAVTICCSCSKKSLCKTTKCRCRSTGAGCGKSCGCALSKCTNREAVQVKLSSTPQSEMAESVLNCSEIVEAEKTDTVASQGAMLLQRALDEKPAEMKGNHRTRKQPLSDIGNRLIESDDLKPARKKKGRKPEIQVVTVDPPSSLPENIKGPRKADKK